MAKILFVDDDQDTMASYVEELREQKHDVTYCSNIDQAVEEVQKKDAKFSLIIWDLSMPPGKAFSTEETQAGLKTGERFREFLRKHRPKIPRLLFTNFRALVADWSQPEDKDYAAAKRDYLPWELAVRVTEILAKERT